MPRLRCPPPTLLGDYLSGRIDAVAAEAVESHALECQQCRAGLNAGESSADPLVQSLREELGEGEFDHEPELLHALESIGNFRNAEPVFKQQAAILNPFVAQDQQLQEAQLGPYRLVKLLGKGGMGLVYQAEHVRLEMVVALKILGDELTSNAQAIARFDREMKAVGRLSHPNIVRATDAGEDQGRHYLAMEFVDGQDLGQILRTRGRLRINDACEVIRQVANGIQHAHDHGLIHRDLKPSNLMISREGQVKVLDLGLARLHLPISGSGLTADYQVMGTADYMAPEQAFQATNVDHRVDIYSLGCTLYALLCGAPPFAGKKHSTSLRKLVAHEQEAPPAAHLQRDEIPLELSAIIERMLAKSPQERFASAAELATSLARFAVGADLAAFAGQPGGKNGFQDATSDLAKYVALVDTVTTSVEEMRVSPPRQLAVRWKSLIAVVAGLLVSAGLLATVLIELTTSEGTIAVVIDDARIAAAVNGEELVIEDQGTHDTYRLSIQGGTAQRRLPVGEYQLRVVNETTGLHFETDEVRISRNDRRLVKAFIKRSIPDRSASRTADIDRACAEWALGTGATVEIMARETFEFVSTVDGLPGSDFFLTNICFKSGYSPTEGEFTQIAVLQRLNQLSFSDIDLSEHMIQGLHGLPHLSNLKLYYNQVSPTGLERIGVLSNLSDLTVGGERVGDAEVTVLCAASKVARITIAGTQVTDNSMAVLGRAEHIEFLSLMFSQVTGRELRKLQRLPALWALHIPYTKLTDEDLLNIADFRHVKWLNLGGTGVTDEGLRYVAAMPSLDVLTLNQSAITNAGLTHLRQAAGLRELDLRSTAIDDAAVDNLAALTQLKRLQIGDRLSADAIRRLKDRLPNCSIEANH